VQLTRAWLRRGFATAGLVILALVMTPHTARAQGITLGEIFELHRSGVSARQILRNAQEYCIAFVITDSVARVLRDSLDRNFADDLRQTCTTTSPLARIAPGTLLDVDFAVAKSLGEFVATDRLCSARFEALGLRFANRRRQGGCVIAYPADPLDGPVRIELTVSGLGTQRAAAVVLGFGRDGSEWNHYSYSIDGEQHVELCVNAREACRRVFYRARVAAVNTAPDAKNRLEVEVRGRNVSLAVNGQLMGTYVAPEAVRGGIVLGVGPFTNVLLEKLVVRSIAAESPVLGARE
jgi:hypothetical protein